MKYNQSHHLICELKLTCGREIILREINQQQTYWGMLGGHPSDTSNNSMVKNALKVAKQHCVGNEAGPFLVPPKRRNFMREEADMDDVIASRSRKVEWLPLVRCIGVFSSSRPARDPSQDESHLTIVWFQDNFAMPIDPEILDEIRSVNWDKLATDICNN